MTIIDLIITFAPGAIALPALFTFATSRINKGA